MPATPTGKAIAARNATTHGLFARDIVLPHLGEDPDGYQELLRDLSQQLLPKNLLERHYVEKIAAASWRLRRLQRWQAQLYEDPALTEDDRLAKLDKVLRQETTLHRQIDTSVRMMGRDVPQLFESRARKQALAELGETERACHQDSDLDRDISQIAQQNLLFAPLPADFDRTRLDNVHAENEKCENEPAPTSPAPPLSVSGVPTGDGGILTPPELGAGGLPNPPVSGGTCDQREQGGGYRRGVSPTWPLEDNRKLEGLMMRVSSETAAGLELLRNAGHYGDLRLLMENYGKISHFDAHVRTSVSKIVYPDDEDDEE